MISTITPDELRKLADKNLGFPLEEIAQLHAYRKGLHEAANEIERLRNQAKLAGDAIETAAAMVYDFVDNPSCECCKHNKGFTHDVKDALQSWADHVNGEAE